MTANSQQVMHDPLRRTKHVSVDSLHHKGFAFSLMGLHQESVIDVAIAKRANTTDIATGHKLAGNAAQILVARLGYVTQRGLAARVSSCHQ